MHPEVVSDEPCSCPDCGMKLMPTAAPKSYVCPMHPEVVSEEQGKCPECGMKLMPASMVSQAHDGHGDDEEVHDGGGGHSHDHAAGDGIEWEDDMVEVNRTTTPSNTRWKLIDRRTGAENNGMRGGLRAGGRWRVAR